MRIVPIFMTVGGLALAAMSVVLAEGVLNPRQTDAAPSATRAAAPAQVVLIAAGTEIAFGDPIRREDLVPQTWPADLAPAGAFDSATALLGPDGTAPRRATQTIREGELILARNISDFGATVTIGSTLAPGTRAVAIRVNTETAVGGFVTPGDRVDIVLTEGAGDTLRTGTILTDIRVLAVDQDTASRGATEARTITVEVTARDSQRLLLAQRAGQLSLTLRNGAAGDDTDDTGQITVNDLWGGPIATPKRTLAEDGTTIRVRRGVTSEEVVHEP